MLEPGPGGVTPPVPETGSLWVTVVTTAGGVLIAAVPYVLGHRAAKKVDPPPDPPKPLAPGEPAPPKVVVADLIRPVGVVEGSPEWALVHMVNGLEKRVAEAEKRSEDRDQEWQERYDQLDRRWQKRYSDLEKQHREQSREHYQALAEVKALRGETENLRAEVFTLRGRLGGGPA